MENILMEKQSMFSAIQSVEGEREISWVYNTVI